jgi:hypothetical protein
MAPPKFQPALLGGLFAGILSALPFVNIANCCCLWVIAGGVIAAYVMQQNHPSPISIGDGAAVGFLAGVIGAIVAAAVSLPINMFLTPMLPGLSDSMWHSRRDMPPEVRDVMKQIPPWTLAVIGGAIFIVIELIFSTLGGLFGALIFRKPTPPSEPPLPPRPPVIPPAGPPVESWSYPDQNQTPNS